MRVDGITAKKRVLRNLWLIGGFVSAFISTLSIINLVQATIRDSDLPASVQTVVDKYEQFLDVILGWLGPPLEAVLGWIGTIVGLRLDLYPHWKHVVALLVVFWAAEIKTDYRRAGLRLTLITMTASLLISLSAGIAAGTLPPGSGDNRTEALMASVPLIIFLSGTAMVAALSYRLRGREFRLRVLALIGFGVGVIIAAPLEIKVAEFVTNTLGRAEWILSPGIVLLGLAILAMAVADLGRSVIAASLRPANDQSWPSAFWENQFVGRAIIILGGFLGAAIVFAAVAGDILR